MMAERACVSEPWSVQLLADNFMSAWLSIEGECTSGEALCRAERAMVSRNVELLCWYQIMKSLGEMGDLVSGSSASGQQETSLVNWKAILTGWSTSIEAQHLSDSSLKLLKLVVIAEKLKVCQKGRATSKTYTEIAKLLFCVSKFTELRDTREQLRVADLCAEAKSLEMLFKIKSEVLYNTNEKLEKKAQAFTPNAVQVFLKIIRQRMEKPNMFTINELASHLESVLQHDSVEEREQLPSLLPQQQQHQEEAIVIVTAAKEDSRAMGQDHLLVPASEREGESNGDLPDMADGPGNGDKMEEANSPASGDHLDEAEGVGGEGRTAITADRGKDDVHGLSEVIEVMDDVEMKDEEEKGEERRDSDSVVPLNLDNLLDRSINVLQLPFVSETVQWSSSEDSYGPPLDSEGVGDGEPKRSNSTSYPPLHISGGASDTSRKKVTSGGGGGGGGRRVRWAEEEVEFLKEGVERFGIGNWKTIRQNYSFNSKRSNMDLRDKWRNMQKNSKQ